MKWLVFLGLALACAGTGCGSDSGSGEQAVTIEFAAMVGDEAFACGDTYENLGSKGSSMDVSDFRFYVQDVQLKNANGDYVSVTLSTEQNPWQLEDVALLDFEDGCNDLGTAEMNSVVTGTVPEGEYDGLRFEMGVPFDLNHANPAVAQSPLNQTAMHWNWQGGYKFLRIDSGNFSMNDWRMHLGSTGCDGDVAAGGTTMCTNPNRVAVDFADFDPQNDVVIADFAALVEGADLERNQNGTPVGCMAGPMDSDCTPLFDNLGLPFGGSEPKPQTFFSVD